MAKRCNVPVYQVRHIDPVYHVAARVNIGVEAAMAEERRRKMEAKINAAKKRKR